MIEVEVGQLGEVGDPSTPPDVLRSHISDERNHVVEDNAILLAGHILASVDDALSDVILLLLRLF